MTTNLSSKSKGKEENESPLKLPSVNVSWSDDDTDLFFQKQIGDFQVLSRLGSGRYGVVKSGEDTKRHIQVAIKLIAKDPLTDIDKYSIRQEAQIMNFLAHSNIIQLYEVIENKQYICMVMEYAAGGELFDYVTRQTRLQEVEARKLFTQILDGLGYCHSHQIIHRDIKAENIFLDEKLETIKIGDWGFSTIYKSGATLETACGSLEYAAPEILSGKPHLGPEVDVWALGVLLYFMVCGWLPFRAATDFDVYSKIKRGQYRPLPSHISDELKHFIEKVFNIDHYTRPSIVDLQKHSWSLKAGEDPNYLKRPKLPRLLQLQIRQYRRNKSDPLLSPRTADPSLNVITGAQETPVPIRFPDLREYDIPEEPKEKEKTPVATSNPASSSGHRDRASEVRKKIPRQKSQAAVTKSHVRTRSTEPPPEEPKPVETPEQVASPTNPTPPASTTAAASTQTQPRNRTARSKSQSTRPSLRENELEETLKKKSVHRRRRKDSEAQQTKRPGKTNRQAFDEGEEDEIIAGPVVIEKPIDEAPVAAPEPVNPSVEVRSISPYAPRLSASPIRSRSPARGGRSSSPPPVEDRNDSSGSGTPTRPKRTSKPRSDQAPLLFPPRPRGKIQNSNFSVLHVDGEGLAKIQNSGELEILTVEQEDNQFVVVVAARAERGQEAKILELLKKFEQNSSKLKRSKSLENIFADVTETTTEPAEILEGENPSAIPESTRKPRRTLTWDAKYKGTQMDGRTYYQSITRHHSQSSELPEIPENAIRRYASAGSAPDMQYDSSEGSEEIPPPPPSSKSSKSKKQKSKKMKKVKIFRPSSVNNNNTVTYNNNNSGSENPPTVVTTPEEEILIF